MFRNEQWFINFLGYDWMKIEWCGTHMGMFKNSQVKTSKNVVNMMKCDQITKT